MLIERQAAQTLLRLIRGFPIVAVTGARQTGKSTLVQSVLKGQPYVSLEGANERRFATEDPVAFLRRFADGAVIDEAQHAPELFSALQSAVDADPRPGRFVLTGSQNFQLIERITQSLAGRIGLMTLPPLSMAELRAAGRMPSDPDVALLQGFYPAVYARAISAQDWYASYVTTYLERDVRQLSSVHDLNRFQRFLRLCAARTAQLLNIASLASDAGISEGSARNWLAILEASYILYRLPPHFANFGKRLIKAPKLHFFDVGLAAALLGIESDTQMRVHPLRPALFETLVVGEFAKARWNAGRTLDLYFWRDNIGTEIDLVLDDGPRLAGVEIKSGATLATDAARNLMKWRSYAAGRETYLGIVYGGSQGGELRQVSVRSWSEL